MGSGGWAFGSWWVVWVRRSWLVERIQQLVAVFAVNVAIN